MNKNAIKKFATEARRELISRVGQRALQYGISDKETGYPNDDSVDGHLLSSTEKKQRVALIQQIKEKGYEQVMEEVAYTWFNRFSALRFMEVNGYLPTKVRVFTDENNAFKPQILTEAIHMELDGLDMEKVYAYKDANDNEGLYKYLLITQCNALNSVLPGMFQKIADYTELLFPDNLLREGSVVQQMIELIPEEDWMDAVQIIGWLYQYYNSEKKDDVFAALKKNVKITKENIPAATQLFTPDWIVRYMVENSLGRLWVEGHPNDELKSKWKYYLEEAEQEPEVQAQLATIREEYKALKPEDILCIDPCSGSGHILAYMFDVLVQIYETYGVDTRTAVASIVENNIYGLDIDDRAAQLAYFSVMMKACQYDKRFLRRKVQPHVYAIVESNHVDHFAVDYFCNGDAKLKAAMDTIIDELHDAKEYGSIITVSPQDWDALFARFDEIQNENVMSIYSTAALELKNLVYVAEVISQKYLAVVTNPPYMGGKSMSAKLSTLVKEKYPNGKSDMFSVFIEVCSKMTMKNGFYGMITQPSFLTLLSFEAIRTRIITTETLGSLIHMGRGIFGIDFGSTAFTIRKVLVASYKAEFYRPHERTFQYIDPDNIEKIFLNAVNNHDYTYNFSLYNTSTENEDTGEDETSKETQIHFTAEPYNFMNIPTVPIAYWVSKQMYKCFTEYKGLAAYAEPKQGMATADNNRFLRFWTEVQNNNIGMDCDSSDSAEQINLKWFPYNKGGAYRKWYGNNEYVVNWKDNGAEIKNYSGSVIRNSSYYFRKGLTWSSISAGAISFRNCGVGFLFDSKGPMCFSLGKVTDSYILGVVNSVVSKHFLKILAPTMDYNQGPIGRIPMVYDKDKSKSIETLVQECIGISKSDWNTFELSWDFVTHPLITYRSGAGYADVPIKKWQYQIADAYHTWESNSAEQFDLLKKNEEELNRIFIDIYGLQDELTPEVEDKDVTVRRADLERDIKSFISYAVGCMFGRYSLDVGGLAYAGGEWDNSKYSTFVADKDNIIPISDDEYFEDDMVGRFVKFVEIVYGKDTLQENLKFIADALGGKGQSKDVIRNYFLNGFYADHCKMYQKRPIYWMFDSGKKNGFKCLIYMHRYQPDTLARIRTDYVHEQQARYRTAIADVENRITNAATSERVKLNKQLKTLTDQAAEIHEYEEKIHHLADQMISIDLDDGVKKNYAIFKDVLAKIK